MGELASWRTETWHPLFVHFPIAILLFATVIKVTSLFMKSPAAYFWQRATSLMLYVGLVFAWVSVYTGDMADGIVSRTLCDPTVLKDHEIAALNMSYLFTAAALLNLVLQVKTLKYARVLHLVVALLMLTGAFFLIQAGHYGAQVVYEQAGGVNIPSQDCTGF